MAANQEKRLIMEQQIKDWLLEESNPEMRLRVLKEGFHYKDDNARIITTKKA